MREYTPYGKGHRMLARLEEGPASGGELRRVADPTGSKKKRDRLWRVVRALKEDGFALRDEAGFYALTRAGADALTCLRGGQPVFVEPTPFRAPAYAVAA